MLGNYGSVLKYMLAVALARASREPLALAHSVRHLGDVYRRMGRAEPAESCYVEALSIYRREPGTKPLDLANTLRGFALLKERCGAGAASRGLWQEAHDLYLQVDVPAGVREAAAKLTALST